MGGWPIPRLWNSSSVLKKWVRFPQPFKLYVPVRSIPAVKGSPVSAPQDVQFSHLCTQSNCHGATSCECSTYRVKGKWHWVLVDSDAPPRVVVKDAYTFMNPIWRSNPNISIGRRKNTNANAKARSWQRGKTSCELWCQTSPNKLISLSHVLIRFRLLVLLCHRKSFDFGV